MYQELTDIVEKQAIDFVQSKDADEFYNAMWHEHEDYLISNVLGEVLGEETGKNKVL